MASHENAWRFFLVILFQILIIEKEISIYTGYIVTVLIWKTVLTSNKLSKEQVQVNGYSKAVEYSIL